MRLFPKLLLSFFAVILAGVLVVSYLANQAAAREVRAFMFQGGMATDAGLAQQLAGYYRGHGSWEGVEVGLEDRSRLLAYGLVRPIRQLTMATGAVARGDLAQRVPLKSKMDFATCVHSAGTVVCHVVGHGQRIGCRASAHNLQSDGDVITFSTIWFRK